MRYASHSTTNEGETMARSTTPHPGTRRWQCALAIALSDIQDAFAECQGRTDDAARFDKDDWDSARAKLTEEERVEMTTAMSAHPSRGLVT